MCVIVTGYNNNLFSSETSFIHIIARLSFPSRHSLLIVSDKLKGKQTRICLLRDTCLVSSLLPYNDSVRVITSHLNAMINHYRRDRTFVYWLMTRLKRLHQRRLFPLLHSQKINAKEETTQWIMIGFVTFSFQ